MRADKLEEVLATMKEENVFSWMLQETCQLHTIEHDSDDGYVTINHGSKEKLCRRCSLGVMIVLSPVAVKAYENGGSVRETYYGLRVLSVLLVLLDDKGTDFYLRLVSAYAPTLAASDAEKKSYEDNLGIPEQTFGHALKINLHPRAKQLEALPIGDTHWRAGARFSTGSKGDTKEKTWIHAARYRELWKAVVYKTF